MTETNEPKLSHPSRMDSTIRNNYYKKRRAMVLRVYFGSNNKRCPQTKSPLTYGFLMISVVVRKYWRSDDFVMSSIDQCIFAGTWSARRQPEILVGASQAHQHSTNKSSTQTPKTAPYIWWTPRLPAICCAKLCHDLGYGNCPNWKFV